jgi:hypothetical protein
VTRDFDFTADTAAFQANLAAQGADGGGDEPEAVPQGFQAALGESWRGTQVAQMLVWVADAPHHDDQTAQMKSVLTSASRYLFLTGDSGVGGSHTAEVPCYCVTRLADAIARSAAMELKGTYVAPSPGSIVRVVGTPVADTVRRATDRYGQAWPWVGPRSAHSIRPSGTPQRAAV